jgi:glycerol uptake facilitator-like aquaporin
MTAEFARLALIAGWIVTILVGFIGAAVVVQIARGKIDLTHLLVEPTTGKASISRLQFLIFTFVIALSLFLVIVADGTPAFPAEIPVGILALLGISGGTFAVAKGVDANRSVESQRMGVEMERTRADMERTRVELEKARNV